MGAGHDHGQQAVRAGERHRGRLWAAFGLLALFMLVEAVAAALTGSLALLSDAGHMFTDVLGIGMALAAITAASKASRTGQRTFGLYRMEVLAALANAVLLFGVASYVVVEAVRRISQPPEVLAGPMLAVAVAGLLANVVAFLLLRSGSQESLNVRGAYLEVLGDLFTSVGVIIAAVVITLTGWWYADPLIAVAVGLFILPRTYHLGRAALRVLVQAAPPHLDISAVRAALRAVDGVADVHDLHVWTLTSGMEVASAHLALERDADFAAVLATSRRLLHDRFAVEHATLQAEPADANGVCHESGW
ncbi:cation diffusion facilitator family transporter [Salinispora arenicola]|uniref:Cation diffusion facilitator family transporter n=1 Tax=Salinispora arenicola (strain CNS-205) TaxID=391037 RepID=A8LXQ3_SALAI|nr:cation diffusion facilitator family transporter [Salinispora arenicola]MCN0152715.1 cation diffusion facilitator family transporter [Salinispora arenicola]MCN0179325.1 cation diffusion facilitator family transporter [Salinispora arenicola]NIL58327.1 cation transporter [Salinispora arenicola]NIL63365.1 cation transporter [Salinispora arenicola]